MSQNASAPSTKLTAAIITCVQLGGRLGVTDLANLLRSPIMTKVCARVEDAEHPNGDEHRRRLKDPKQPLMVERVSLHTLGKLGHAVDAADLEFQFKSAHQPISHNGPPFPTQSTNTTKQTAHIP